MTEFAICDHADECSDKCSAADPHDSALCGHGYEAGYHCVTVDAVVKCILVESDLLAALQAVEWVEISGDGFMLIDVCPCVAHAKRMGTPMIVAGKPQSPRRGASNANPDPR